MYSVPFEAKLNMSKEIISINPATLEEIGRLHAVPKEEVKGMVSRARAACPVWQRMGFKKRAQYLLKARKYLLDNIDDFAKTITLENGKPLTEALTSEIYPIADLIYYFAHNAEKLLKEYTISIGVMGLMARSSRISFQPVGVVGIISPWNFPFSIPAGEAVMALLCGNAVILKPSSITSLIGKKIEEMLKAADIPPGIFQLLLGGAENGEALVEARVDKLLFTGSEAVGQTVMGKCSQNLTPVVLELGGKDPMIVRADANLEQATSGAIWGAFVNSGQCCAGVERVYVHESVYDEFVGMVVHKTEQLKQGPGINPENDIGAMTNQSQLNVVKKHVEDARQRGANILCGGEPNIEYPGYFFKPTVLTKVDHSFCCVREETFGPLMPIMSFEEDRQAIQLANDTRFGLTASIWSKDFKKAKEMAKEILAGTVTINDCVFTHALSQTPWGGRKASGFGRTHSRFGLQELVTVHHIHTNRLACKDFWWYPYSQEVFNGFKNMAKYLTDSWSIKSKAIPTFLRLFKRKKI